jgi:lysophospholipase L1-like esterase
MDVGVFCKYCVHLFLNIKQEVIALQITKKIILDIDKNIYTKIDAKQNDVNSRFIEITLINNGLPLNLTGNTVKIFAIKSDNTIIFNNVEIIDYSLGRIKVELTSQALAVIGNLECELVVYGLNSSILSSKAFIINVIKSIRNDEAVESADEFTALTNALNTVQQYDSKIINLEEVTGEHNTDIQGLEEQSQQLSDKIGDLVEDIENNEILLNEVEQSTKPYNSDKEVVFGKEYLSTIHKAIMNTIPFTTVISGDSTTENLTVVDKYKVHNILKSLFDINGLPFTTVLNHGHSGQGTFQWSQSYVNDDIASNPKLLILRWGLNDPAGGASIADTEFALRDGLTKFRNAKPYNQCSIILMTPNSTNNDANGRGQAWHKAINSMFRKVARDFQCCFIDTYALLQDSFSSIASEYMDNVAGVHVHPQDVMNIGIISKLFDVIVPNALHMSSTNNFINDTYIGLLSANGLPSFFNRGLSIYKADTNFPYPNSPVYTIKSMDDVAMQINYSLDKSKYAMRTGQQSTNLWSKWIYVGGSPATNLTLINGWLSFGAPGKIPKYWVNSDNELCLEGLVKSGTIGTSIATLPASVSPLGNEYFRIGTSTGSAMIVVQGDGNIICQSASDNAWISLSGIRCRLD